MAASMRLLARLYISGPRTQSTVSLLGGRCKYSKDRTGSGTGNETALVSNHTESDAAVEPALEAAAKSAASAVASGTDGVQTVTKEILDQLKRVRGSMAGSSATRSITRQLMSEEGRMPGKKPAAAYAATLGHLQPDQRHATDDGSGRQAVSLVDRRRAAASYLSPAAAGKPPQGGGSRSQDKDMLNRPQQRAGVKRLPAKDQLVHERQSAVAAMMVTQPAEDGQESRPAVSATLVPAASLEADMASHRTAGSATHRHGGVLASLLGAEESTAKARDQQQTSSAVQHPQGQSMTVQLFRDKEKASLQKLKQRHASPSAPHTVKHKGDILPSNAAPEHATAERFRHVLDESIRSDTDKQAAETKQNMSVFELMMAQRPTREYGASTSRETYKLFEGGRLNVFHPEKWQVASDKCGWNSLWAAHINDAAQAAAHLPPTNAFEEHIQLTQEGKLWTFPIDNEAGMEREHRVPFYEHVFLEKHLTNFPKKGPVRYFMELVVNGLSKNPHVTVEDKVEHIKWFENYFAEKKKLLEDYHSEQQHATASV